MSDYPEHDKVKALDGKNNVVGDFIEWLRDNDYVIAQYGGEEGYERLWPVHRSTEDLISEHFEIDRNALEREKRAMLESIRAHNEESA